MGASQARVDPGAVGAEALAETAALMPALLRTLQATMTGLCEASAMPDAAFDLAVTGAADGLRAWLLDANPLIDVTDVGWFTRPGAPPAFDRTARYRQAGKIVSLPLPPAEAVGAGR